MEVVDKYDAVLTFIELVLSGCEVDTLNQGGLTAVELQEQYDGLMEVLESVQQNVEDDILTQQEVLQCTPESIVDLICDVAYKLDERLQTVTN